MRFNSLFSGAQAQIDLNCIDYPYVEYIKLMIISLIYYPYLLNDKNFLVIGLGGGILPKAIRKLYPMSSIDIVEIDPLVNEIAKKYFYFQEDTKMKVFINDGRKYLKRISNKNFYDIIFVDAYDSISGLPKHMKTKEFFIELKNCLNNNGGLLIINLVCIYQSYNNVRQTINNIFDKNHLITFRSSDFVNVIAVASSSIQEFPIINQQTNIINHIQQTLSINVNSLVKQKQKQLIDENLSSKIYTDDMINIEDEQHMSLTQFVDIV